MVTASIMKGSAPRAGKQTCRLPRVPLAAGPSNARLSILPATCSRSQQPHLCLHSAGQTETELEQAELVELMLDTALCGSGRGRVQKREVTLVQFTVLRCVCVLEARVLGGWVGWLLS